MASARDTLLGRVILDAGAGEALIGLVGAPGTVIDVTLSTDTSAYADGDVLADFQAVADFVRAEGGLALIQSVTVLDKADQGVAFDILTCPSAVSLGTENAAASISDADAAGVQRVCRIEAADYVDLGGCRVATRAGIGLVVAAAPGSRSMRIGAIARGAGTFAADSLVLRFGLAWF